MKYLSRILVFTLVVQMALVPTVAHSLAYDLGGNQSTSQPKTMDGLQTQFDKTIDTLSEHGWRYTDANGNDYKSSDLRSGAIRNLYLIPRVPNKMSEVKSSFALHMVQIPTRDGSKVVNATIVRSDDLKTSIGQGRRLVIIPSLKKMDGMTDAQKDAVLNNSKNELIRQKNGLKREIFGYMKDGVLGQNSKMQSDWMTKLSQALIPSAMAQDKKPAPGKLNEFDKWLDSTIAIGLAVGAWGLLFGGTMRMIYAAEATDTWGKAGKAFGYTITFLAGMGLWLIVDGLLRRDYTNSVFGD